MTMTNAVVLIEAERDALSTLGGALADIDGVAEAYSVTGEWDFVAIVRVPDHEQLAEVVTSEIGTSPASAHADDGRVRGLLAPRPRSALLSANDTALLARCRSSRQYGPTLGALLAPRWRAASLRARRADAALLVLASCSPSALALTLENATTHTAGSGPVQLQLSRARTASRRNPAATCGCSGRPGGALEYSFAVEPLTLPPLSRRADR